MQNNEESIQQGQKPLESNETIIEEAGKDESFRQYFDEGMRTVNEGEVIQGKIVQIGKDHVMVDIGYKSEGQISVREFISEEGILEVKEGDTVEVLLMNRGDVDGVIHLSKNKADKLKVWEDVRRAYEGEGTVEGKVVARIKGGLSVDIGLPAFLPGSQVDIRPVRTFDRFIGQTFKFKILKFNRRRNNIVLSRRSLLEEERATFREKTLSELQEDQIVKGIVKNITDYGAFIDLGGIDGLLHITDMSWGRIKHPSEVIQVGSELEVKVLHFDAEKERVSLGLKQTVPDPWSFVEEKYLIGSRVSGKVVSITDYGSFVELEKGVEGLVHISEMSWTRKIRHPSRIVNEGDIIDAIILNLNLENRRISLGMKQVKPNPWITVSQKYPVGTKIQGRIRNITEFGIFIGLDEGIDGMVHVSDISWTKRIRHPSEIYKKGLEVQAIVLHIDKDEERFSLGIKQLEPDPWHEIPKKYPTGAVVKGKVTSLTDFGVFLEIEEGIEGLIHISELSKEKVKDPADVVKEGDVISALVINVDSKDRKIGLSVKGVERAVEEETIKGYMDTQRSVSSNFGILLGEELKKKASQSETSFVADVETSQLKDDETKEKTSEKDPSDQM